MIEDMESTELKPAKAPIVPRRKCGHPGGWSFDFTELYNDGTGRMTSFCAGCVMEKFGIKPVAEYKIIRDEKSPNGFRLEKIWGD